MVRSQNACGAQWKQENNRVDAESAFTLLTTRVAPKAFVSCAVTCRLFSCFHLTFSLSSEVTTLTPLRRVSPLASRFVLTCCSVDIRSPGNWRRLSVWLQCVNKFKVILNEEWYHLFNVKMLSFAFFFFFFYKLTVLVVLIGCQSKSWLRLKLKQRSEAPPPTAATARNSTLDYRGVLSSRLPVSR